MNNCEKCPWHYDNAHYPYEDGDWGCLLFGPECGGCKLVNDYDEGTYGCLYPQKVLQHLAHRYNRVCERLANVQGWDGIFSGRKFQRIPNERGYCEFKPAQKGGHNHNHIYNACNRAIFRSSDGRKPGKGNKEFHNIFFMNLSLGNAKFSEFQKVIFHGRRKGI